jgi:hypothetical protein
MICVHMLCPFMLNDRYVSKAFSTSGCHEPDGSFEDKYTVTLHEFHAEGRQKTIWLPLDREVSIRRDISGAYTTSCTCCDRSSMDGPCRHLFCVVCQNGSQYENCIEPSVGETWRKRAHEQFVTETLFDIQDTVHHGANYNDSVTIMMPKMKARTFGFLKKCNSGGSQKYNF